MDNLDGRIDLGITDDKGRDEPDVPVGGAVDEDPPGGAPLLDLGAGLPDGDPDHEPPDPGIMDREAVPEPLSLRDHRGEDPLDDADGREGRGTGQGPAGESGAMLPLQELEPFAGHECPHGEAAPDPLCERHDVGFYLLVLDGKPPPGPPHAGLDLVVDEECPRFVTDSPDAGHEALRRDDHPRLSLDGLDEDPGGVLRDG